jgi:hypothetical protein
VVLHAGGKSRSKMAQKASYTGTGPLQLTQACHNGSVYVLDCKHFDCKLAGNGQLWALPLGAWVN